MLAQFLTPEVLLIAAVMVVIVIVFFFALVANKLSSVDSHLNEMRDGLEQRTSQSIKLLSDQLHDDMAERSRKSEESLAQMGDSWRNALNKTVSDLRSEIGKLEADIGSTNKELRDTLIEQITDHSAEVNEHLAQVRDNNHSEIQGYHKQLANQVREHAAVERDSLNRSLTEIADAVKANLGQLAEQQSDTLLDVSGKVADGYSKITEDLRGTIRKVSGDVSEDFSAVAGQISSTAESFDKVVKENLRSVSDEVSTTLGNITSKLDTSVGSIATDVSSNLSELTADTSSKLLGSIERIDREMSDATEKLSDNLEGINSTVGEGIERYGHKIDIGFEEIEEKINKRIHKELQGLLDIFRGFADRVDVVKETQDRIEDLAANVGVLAETLDDRRARGSFGEVVVESIVRDNLNPTDYELNATLSNGTRVACLLRLPKPTGSIAISSNFDQSSLEDINSRNAKERERKAARKEFASMLKRAINETAEDCIIPDETADGAVLLLPSEAAFSEAHSNHRALVDQAYASRVWLASPATLLAMTTVARSVIKDAGAREEIAEVSGKVRVIVSDFSQLESDIRHIDAEIEGMHRTIDDTRRTMRRVSRQLGDLDTQLRDSPELIEYQETRKVLGGRGEGDDGDDEDEDEEDRPRRRRSSRSGKRKG